ncbi:VWA domain-containing protein [Roseimaritima ulvae]|uniref:VWFA domain-containing protein n=1 Tax=Roseimaritima ulvae TaxID=980254 RepID=A0A5B9R4L6_9BACT|nr:VWA domain-containing protein [Roseimaritima ulvae]QEG41411.1 hypothetical protein UC8_34320 [Roseimaritima ulvae]
MSFAWPAGFLFALLALPILVLYILKVRMRRLPVSTNLFWKQVYDEKPPRSLWRQLRHLLSLLAQVLILCLLVGAIVDPYLPWQLLQARRIVLVVDNSASMQATDVSPTRLAVAKDEAQQLISGLRERDQVAIVLGGRTPEVMVGMTGHIPTLRRALDAIPQSENATHLQPAIELGQQLVGEHPHGEVVVLTDGCLTVGESRDAETTPPADDNPVPVSWKTVAGDANNVGITQFQTRRSLTDPLGYEILVSVWNAADVPVKCRLEITLDDVPVDVLPLELAADEQWHRSLEKTSIEGGTMQATLTAFQNPQADDDSAPSNAVSSDSRRLNRLTVDDTAWAVLPARNRQRVLVISPGNLFLRKVFEANPLVDLEVRETFPESWPADTVIVLHGQVPEQLPAGSVFVIDPENDCEQWTVGKALEHPIITEQDEASPLMTHIRLDNVLVPQAKQLRFTNPPTVLAGTVSGDAIYAQPKRDNGRCLVLSVNLEQSDLAFRTAFPIMVTNALNWFAHQSGRWQPAVNTGALLTIDLSETAVELPTELRWLTPSGVAQTLPAEQTNLTLGPFDQTGVWSLRQPARDAAQEQSADEVDDAAEATLVRSVAVNLADERETDLRPDADLVELTNDRQWGSGWLNRPIWFYVTLLACGAITIEWWLYQRRLLA